MSTKNQQKQKHSKNDDDEIIEIEDISNQRQSRVSQKRKEQENTSSEATTPNKKKKNKRKNEDAELIEIMDIESPEIPNKKKASSPTARPKKSEIKITENNEKGKKREKPSVKSVSKINAKDKSPLNKKKKEIKVASITLEESDNDSDMEEITEINAGSTRKKSTTKIPGKKSSNKSRTNVSNQSNKNKKSERKSGKNEKNQDIIQYNLSDEESDKEEEKGKGKAGKVQNKYPKKNRKKSSRTETNSGYYTIRKTSKSSLKKIEDKGTIKSKSTIKVFRKEKDLKDTLNNLLGRKRKLSSKSKTPHKKANKPGNTKDKDKAQSKNQNQPKVTSQSSLEKAKSPNPGSRAPKKNYKNNNSISFEQKVDIDLLDSNKKFSTPECAILNQLILEYGFERVLDALCKSKLDQKNKLDSCLQGLKDSCTNNKLPYLLMKMLLSYFESKFDEQSKRPYAKRSTSANKSTSISILNDNPKSKNLPSNSPLKNNKTNKADNPKKDKNQVNISPIEIDEEEEEVKGNTMKNEKKALTSKTLNVNNNTNTPSNNVKGASKQEAKKGEKKATSIGSHYNKTTDGEIYKYQVSNLDGKGNAVFKCYDEKCTGVGIYDIESKKFTVSQKHSLKYAEHEFIINMEKENDNIFKDLKTTGKSDAQVFKENGERTVKMY